jgi:hypothetical protein
MKVNLVKVQFPEMQLRLIERFVDEGVVAPDVHKRILATKRPVSTLSHVQEAVLRDAPL